MSWNAPSRCEMSAVGLPKCLADNSEREGVDRSWVVDVAGLVERDAVLRAGDVLMAAVIHGSLSSVGVQRKRL